jgi:transcriptional regulator GlxA family with amidase domain
MDAHWDRPLTIEAVAQACGGSVRSVYSSFRQESGMSPMAYLRDVRLTHARQLLQEDQGSVIDVALRCGFASLGHFARRYRAKFAELPSQTHARGRAGRGVGGED